MKIIVLKASESDYIKEMTVNSIEELAQIYVKLIINFHPIKQIYGEDVDAIVTIYDDYVE